MAISRSYGLTLLLAFAGCLLSAHIADAQQPSPPIKQLIDAALALKAPAARLAKLEDAGGRALAAKDTFGQAECSFYAGRAHAELYQWAQAIKQFERAISLYKTSQATFDAGVATHELGVATEASGNRPKALEIFAKAIELERAAKDDLGRAATLLAVARVYDDLGEREKALANAETAAKLFHEHQSASEGVALNYVGRVLEELGLRKEALEKYGAAMKIFEAAKDTQGRAQTLTNIGLTHSNLGHPTLASHFYESALPLWGANEAGRAGTLNNLGKALKEIGRYEDALKVYREASELWMKMGNRAGQALILNNVGRVFVEMGKFQEALDQYSQALLLEREGGLREMEAITLRNCGYALDKLNLVPLAIAFGKQSVQQFQTLRSDLRALPLDFQRAYAQEAAPAYRFLAEKLIQVGRLAEAEQVIALLKDDEFFRFARGGRGQDIDLTPHETAWKEKYRTLGGGLGALAAQYDSLLRTAKSAGLTPAQESARAEVAKQLMTAREAFTAFLQEAAKAFSASSGASRIDDLKTATELALIVKGAPTRTAAVYTLVTQDGVRTILTLPNLTALKDGQSSKIGFSELSSKIARLRTALTTPEYDPIPLASELYDILVRPLEADLKGAGIERILWSLDGPLRYLPLAALYDRESKQFLFQKYACSLFTPAKLVALTRKPAGEPSAVGFGVSKPHDVNKFHFEALSAVPAEMAEFKRITGARVFTDETFTEASLQSALALEPSLVHLATHFELRPGDPKDSFLLLGDGKPLAIASFGTWLQGVLGSVDLFVISACNTATPVGDVEGNELESFSRAAQENGAAAVLATLWPVNDASTGLFMAQFYARQKAVGKAEALREAQTWLMGANAKDLGNIRPRSGNKSVPTAFTDLPPYHPDPEHPFAHPYYWAPFVLTGNPN